MPSEEPNSKMDPLLRAYAKQRREQAGPAAEMHPATRKLLHDEVRRTFGLASAQPRQVWRTWRWPLVAFGGGLAALLVMFAMINAQMHKLSPASAPAERRLSDARPVTKAPAPVAKNTGPAALAPAPSRQPSVTIAPSASPLPSFQTAHTDGANEAAQPLLYQRLSEAKPAPSDESEVAAGEFVQIHDRAGLTAAPSPPSNILSTFQMRRSGQIVSVVDADGSVYNGQVLGGSPVNIKGFGGGHGSATEGMARTRQAANNDVNFAFKVAGTNHNLQQNIVFTGNVQEMPPAPAAAKGAALNQNAPQVQNANASRVTGKVQVDGGKEFEIEAKPPAP